MYRQWEKLKKLKNVAQMKKLVVAACKMLVGDDIKTSRINAYASTWSIMTDKVFNENPATLANGWKGVSKEIKNKVKRRCKSDWARFYISALVVNVFKKKLEVACYYLGQIYLMIPKKKETFIKDFDLDRLTIDLVWDILAIIGNTRKVRELQEISNFFIKKNPNSSTDRLPLFHCVINMILVREYKVVNIPIINDKEINGYYDLKKEKIELPDYVYDKHTALGKSKKHGVKHFFSTGAYLSNECIDFNDPFKIECQKIYLNFEKEFGTKRAKYQNMRNKKRKLNEI